MFYLLQKTILHGKPSCASSPTHKLMYILQNNPSVSSLRFLSSTSSNHSFSASYLINECEFPTEFALSVSKSVRFETPDKPNSVIAFFKDHGFSRDQILRMVRRLPSVLLCRTESTLLPKLEFFYSKGASQTEVAKILCNYPTILRRSLKKQIIPCYNFLLNLLKSDEKAMHAIRRYSGILVNDLDAFVKPNIQVLKEYGVSDSRIMTMIHYQPRIFFLPPVKFKEVVEEVKKLGFEPSKFKFVVAVFLFRSLSKATWERKVEAFKNWGWSEKEIVEAFQRNPWFMATSEDKIEKVMEFLLKKMGYQPAEIARRPIVISLSMKRIVPRGLFAKVLLSEGLIKNFPLHAFEFSEKSLLDRFVIPYKKEAVYQEILSSNTSE